MLLTATAACGSQAEPRSSAQQPKASEGSDDMIDSFDRRAISQIKELQSLTLWRVGLHAKGPGRHPKDGVAAIAAENKLTWAFSIDGDGRFDGTYLPGTSDSSSVEEAQAALVTLVETVTGRTVSAAWTESDADTWTASAKFAD